MTPLYSTHVSTYDTYIPTDNEHPGKNLVFSCIFWHTAKLTPVHTAHHYMILMLNFKKTNKNQIGVEWGAGKQTWQQPYCEADDGAYSVL